tara:strand:- start:529 stop:699 length:171 start_codon:yes stop_codon:yes gene_type:complete
MKNIEKFRIGFGLLIIVCIIYDNYLNQSQKLIPGSGLIVIAFLYALIYYFAKMKNE